FSEGNELFGRKKVMHLSSVPKTCNFRQCDLAYAKFPGAPLKVHKITNLWRNPTVADCPAFQKYNADYDLSAKGGADTLAPTGGETAALDVTRRWNTENITFPLNFLLPNHIHNQQLERLRLVRGDPRLEPGHQLEKLYHDVLECMNLLSHRLGLHKFFFRDSPSSLDANVFGHLAPLLKVKLPTGKLHQHLNSQDNLRHYCTNGLVLYFPSEGGGKFPGVSVYSDGSDFDNEPHEQRNQILSVLFAMGSMLGYAILMGIVMGPHHIKEEEEE
uniref:Metaxin glutathione S-transferase domain-containing protein n=1 Tax=Oncorhynchus tshawytscha TaxID=74940 RepID=A0AAZ3QA30_ONCTS